MSLDLTPLNGTKTHPLSDFARKVLGEISESPKPRQSINPGVVNRLLIEDLVKIVQLPSPYTKNKNKPIDFLKITKAGREILT